MPDSNPPPPSPPNKGKCKVASCSCPAFSHDWVASGELYEGRACECKHAQSSQYQLALTSNNDPFSIRYEVISVF